MMEESVEEPSRAATIIGGSGDLLPEILIRLPPKTLMKFKLVSKQWLSLISDREFSIKHSRKTYEDSDSRAPRGLFLYYHFYKSSNTETVSVPLFGNPPGSVPPLSFLNRFAETFGSSGGDIQSCNGLLLCLFFKRNLRSPETNDLHCVVCNPTTRDCKVLPILELEVQRGEWFDGLALVFNPLESNHYKVVGIKRERHYKVVGISGKVHIYSSKTDSWKSGSDINQLGDHMHDYNMNSEKVGRLDIPTLVHLQDKYFAESCGRLYLAVTLYDYNHNDPECSLIYEFDSSSMQWLDPQLEILEDANFSRSMCAVVRGKNDGEFVIFHTTTKRLIIFDSVLQERVEDLYYPESVQGL